MYRASRSLIALSVLGLCGDALANGRYPATTSVHGRPADPQSIYLAATFGLLISHDDGAHFYWICEEAIGYGGTFDPKYRIGPTGTLFATTFNGLSISRDQGCTWAYAGGVIAGQWIDAVDVASNGAVWAATSTGGMPNDVFLSHDDGATFASVGLLDDRAWWKSVVAAPGDPQRVYVGGYTVSREPAIVLFYRTDDEGVGWTPLPTDEIALAAAPSFLFEAVDPKNPDVVYGRSVGVNPPVGDRLYRSDDAGLHWTSILDTTDSITGFVIRSDGSLLAGTIADGVHLSTDRGMTWTTPAQQPKMACVSERSDGTLLACGANWKPDMFALGRSADGQQWAPVMRFGDITAPLACPAGSVQRDTCEAKKWPSIREQFGIGTPDAGVPAMSDGGIAPPEEKGCCDGGAGAASAPLAAAVAMILVGLTRRRRSRP
jgi:hypothetical protein